MINLKHLDISYNELGPKSVEHILSSLKKLISLTYLDISDNDLSQEDIDLIKEESRKYKKLRIDYYLINFGI